MKARENITNELTFLYNEIHEAYELVKAYEVFIDEQKKRFEKNVNVTCITLVLVPIVLIGGIFALAIVMAMTQGLQ